jgi:hypothetical protein
MGKRKYLLISFVLVSLFSCVLLISSFLIKPEIRNCIVIGFSSEFENINGYLFLSKDTPESLRDSIFSIIKNAEKRVCTFWKENKRIGNPKIIFCYSEELFQKYSRNKTILTYKTPINSYIVFGKRFINLDMISHELFHTELYSRVGYRKSIPVWFDEGLALQVDYRKEYSEDRYLELQHSIKQHCKLTELKTANSFWSNNYYYHYLLSGHTVASWLKAVGKEGLDTLITKLNAGNEFDLLYNRYQK